VWQNTDPDRCGIVPAVFKEGFGFGDWVEYALDVPLFFLERDEKLAGDIGKTFRRYMKEGFDGRPATRRDWETHLTTLFPEARFRQWIEVRSIDRLAGALAYGAPVFVRYLFDRPDTRTEALKILAELGFEDCRRGLEAAARSGLEAKLGHRRMLDIAEELVRVVEKRASAAMSPFERKAFESVKQQVYDKRMCPADEMIRELNAGAPLMDVIRARAL
jgi:glutamate--cysteine ligase